MTKTTKERQEDYRARRALEGLQEVRGVFLPPEMHQTLKNYAAKLLKRSPPKGKSNPDEPQKVTRGPR